MAYSFGELWGNYGPTLPAGGRYTFLAFWVTAGDDDLHDLFVKKAQELQASGLSLLDQDGVLVPNYYPDFIAGSDGSQTAIQDLCIGFYENNSLHWYGFLNIKMLYQSSFGIRYAMWIHDNNGPVGDRGLFDGWQAFSYDIVSSTGIDTIYIHVASDYDDNNNVYITGNVLTTAPNGGYTLQSGIASA